MSRPPTSRRGGAVKLAVISLDPHPTNPRAPTHTTCYKAFIGVTDDLELDARVIDPNHGTMPKTHWNATARLLHEDAENPNVVIGVNDITQQYVYSAGPRSGQRAERAYFVAAAKTLNPTARGKPPEFPVWRLHLGFGTRRNAGFFGGVQVKVSPKIGLVGFFLRDDVQFAPKHHDWVYAVNYAEGQQWPTLQIGKCGRADVICVSYTFGGR
jgi:hypothetical protein